MRSQNAKSTRKAGSSLAYWDLVSCKHIQFWSNKFQNIHPSPFYIESFCILAEVYRKDRAFARVQTQNPCADSERFFLDTEITKGLLLYNDAPKNLLYIV